LPHYFNPPPPFIFYTAPNFFFPLRRFDLFPPVLRTSSAPPPLRGQQTPIVPAFCFPIFATKPLLSAGLLDYRFSYFLLGCFPPRFTSPPPPPFYFLTLFSQTIGSVQSPPSFLSMSLFVAISVFLTLRMVPIVRSI